MRQEPIPLAQPPRMAIRGITRSKLIALVMGALIITTTAVRADIIDIIGDQAAWEGALASQESIFFTEIPSGSIVTDQYADLGVLFTDGDDIVLSCGSCSDGRSLLSLFDIDFDLVFDRPRTAVAIEHPGTGQMQLFNRGELIHTSDWGVAEPGQTLFLGVLSDQPFDAVRIFRPGGSGPVIDNLYFGDVIPAPGGLALLGVAGAPGLAGRRRRRG